MHTRVCLSSSALAVDVLDAAGLKMEKEVKLLLLC